MSKINPHLFFASLFLGVSFSLAGCEDATGTEEDRSVLVDHADLDALANDEFFVVDAHDGIVYNVDPSAVSLARARVMLVAGDGVNILLDEALRSSSALQNGDPGEFVAPELSISTVQPDESAIYAPNESCKDIVIYIDGKPIRIPCGWPN